MQNQNPKITGLLNEIRKESGLEIPDGRRCINCRRPFTSETVRNKLEIQEAGISGFCGLCWDEIFSHEEGD